MKIHISRIQVILIFILFNLILFSGLIFLKISIDRNSISSVAKSENNQVLSVFSGKIKDLNLTSKAFIIYDSNLNIVIAGKNEELRFSPASTAKIMAAIIVLENYNLDTVLTAQNVASIGVDNSKMGLFEGEKITVRNLLYGMMLPSGNDAAYVLAANFDGGILGFVTAMNKKASALQMENTQFFDPDGYDDQNYTTGFDMARLAAFAMQNSTFAKIVGTRQIMVYDATGFIPHNLENLNELLGTTGVTGVKTGFTNEANGVLVTSIENRGKRYVIVVLSSENRFADTEEIIKNVVNNLKLISY